MTLLAAIIATSYAPGHNFWPGTPLEWIARGALAFLIISGPQLLVGALLVFRLIRCCQFSRVILFTLIVSAVWAFWPALVFPPAMFRGGDQPVYRGLVWGHTSRTAIWILSLTCFAMIWRRRPIIRHVGFDVVPISADESEDK